MHCNNINDPQPKTFNFVFTSVDINKTRVLENGPNKICGRQPLKKLEGIWSA